MRTYIQPGEVVTAIAPTGGILSGKGLFTGALFGVAAYDAAEGAEVEMQVVGVFELPKASGAISRFAKVYWDDTNKVCTGTASGNKLIGVAMIEVASGAATVRVRLDGSAI